MITVGLVNELRFMSLALKQPLSIHLEGLGMKGMLSVDLKDGILFAFYRGIPIWLEDVSSDISMFGVESCDSIARIIRLIDSGDEIKWKELMYLEKKT